jgi:NADH-quinone oxidoreductase subunit G
MPDVNITVDGKKITAPAGSLLIEACKSAGIEVPSFCYYPGLSLQGACRMCLVKIEKMPKLQTACTTVISEGMTVQTEIEEVRQARQAMLEFVLQNHPLDCPVCDAGGECELQDMTLSYGASESKLIDFKNHKQEEQWSPVVFFDRPRCILCYRCVRVCNEAMDVGALGIQNRGVMSLIAPNHDDHLECEECGMCIDICPVGALTSGSYRYKTRPWEMKHVGTVCTHCGDGCKTTLGVRCSEHGAEIVRGDNRDKSGINGDFLCVKGRYAFDFAAHEERLRQPLVRKDGRLAPATWEQTLELVAGKFKEARDREGGAALGVIGSTRTTNEESYLLQKFARAVLGSNNIDHHRTADYPAFMNALAGKKDATAGMRDVFSAPAILLIGSDPTYQHPLLAYQIRNNVRLRRARLYVINSFPVKLKRQAAAFARIPEGSESKAVAFLGGDEEAAESLVQVGTTREALTALRDKLRGEKDLVIIFGPELRGPDVAALVRFGSGIPGAKFICLGDYANSRGAADMGLYPDLLPGYLPLEQGQRFRQAWGDFPAERGLNLKQMVGAAKRGELAALYVVGSNPVARFALDPFALAQTFVVVQDMFLTETAAIADVVLPAANAYEKSGSMTNTCGDLQLVQKAGDFAGPRADLEIIAQLAARMGFALEKLLPRGEALSADLGESRGAQAGEADRHAVWLERQNMETRVTPFSPAAVREEIQRLVPGYGVDRLNLLAGNDVHTRTEESAAGRAQADKLILPAHDDLFTSGTLGRYSSILNQVMERRLQLPGEKEVAAD